jgi:hypothetical protein
MIDTLISRWLQMDLWVRILTIVLIPFLAWLVYWLHRNFELSEITIWVAKLERKDKESRETGSPVSRDPPELIRGSELGAAFRRYFAEMLARPFYELPDQQRILSDAQAILKAREVPIVVLHGAGGVGKTALAAEIVRQARPLGFLKSLGDSAKTHLYEDAHIQEIEEPARLEWEALVNTLLTQLGSPSLVSRPLSERENWLRRQLRLEPYLVLVDNLEAVDNARSLAARLRDMLRSSNSCGLLTYRYRDLGELNEVYAIGVQGLNRSNSLTFLQRELETRGHDGLKAWMDERNDDRTTLLKIIDLTRGLPLALQLVVGLRVTLPLTSIFTLLQEVTADARVEDLYEFLYRTELAQLSSDTRQLLTAAFARQPGYFLSDLSVETGFSEADLLTQMAELSRLSLVYSLRRDRSDQGREDFFYVHPMLHQLLHKMRRK